MLYYSHLTRALSSFGISTQNSDMELDLDLDDTLAIVTGAGGQIGQVIVKAFLRAGCRVGALDIDESKFNIQDDRLLWLKVDVTDEEQVQSAWQKIEKYFSRCPTVCICAAGLDLSFVTQHKSAVDLPVDQFRRTLDVVCAPPVPSYLLQGS